MERDFSQSVSELHRLLEVCICNPVETPPGWEEKLDELLSVPGILLAADDQNTLPIDWFKQAGYGYNQTSGLIARKLIEAGANPLIGNPSNDSVLLDQFVNTSYFDEPILGIEMLFALSGVEFVNRGVRSQTGETALHILGRLTPGYMFEALSALDASSKIPMCWINAQDQNGCTPLHAFCGNGSFLLKTLKKARKSDDEMDEDLWKGMDKLIALGADLSIKNRQRVSAASCILHCVKMKLPVDGGEAFRVVAAAQAAVLMDQTKQSSMKKSSLRL